MSTGIQAAAVRRWLGAVPMVSASLVLVTALVQWLVNQATPLLTFERCVTPGPTMSAIGVELSLLRHDANCVSGVAVNPVPGRVICLVITVAVPTLVANILTTAGLAGAWVMVRRLGTRVAGGLRRVWPRLPEATRIPELGLPRPVPRSGGPVLLAWQLDRSPVLRRGPPALCVA